MVCFLCAWSAGWLACHACIHPPTMLRPYPPTRPTAAFGASLAAEVRPYGIDVLVFHPSPVATRFYDKVSFDLLAVMFFYFLLSRRSDHLRLHLPPGFLPAGPQAGRHGVLQEVRSRPR